MLYQEIMEDEQAEMDQQLEEPTKRLEPHQVQVPLRSLMRPALTMPLGASVQEAVDAMLEHGLGYVVVVSEDGRLVGIFGERDVLLKILDKVDAELCDLAVTDYMAPGPQTLHADDSLDTAIVHMATGRFRHIPIVDSDNRPVGMVSIRHIIKYLVEHFPQEILTLPQRPVRDAMRSREGA